jgi:hypothetical protein
MTIKAMRALFVSKCDEIFIYFFIKKNPKRKDKLVLCWINIEKNNENFKANMMIFKLSFCDQM